MTKFTDNFLKQYQNTPPQVISIAMAAGIALYGMYLFDTYLAKPTGSKYNEDGITSQKPPQEVPLVPGGLPYFGHIFQLPSEIPAFKFDEWHRKYGPLIRINMGIKSWIIIGDSDIANDILRVKGAITSDRPFHLFTSQYVSLGKRGMVFADADKRWKQSRAIAQSLFGPKGVSRKVHTFKQEAEWVSEMLLKDTLENGHVNILKSLQVGTLNLIMQTFFAKRAESLDDPLAITMIDLTGTSIKLSAPDQDMPTFLPAFSALFGPWFKSNEKEMREFVHEKRDPVYWRLIREALESDEDCFVKILYELKDENELEDDDILLFVVDIIEAGTDTTAMTLSWAFVILSHYKDVQKRLHTEIDKFIAEHGRLPEYEERENFPLLISVQKECMRYRTTVPSGIPHEVTEDFEYQGYLIHKGAVLLSNTYTLNLSEALYDKPREFVPERYMLDQRTLAASVSSSASRGRDQFMFGWGRRTCPGVHMADVEMFYFWVRILATSIIEPTLDHQGQPRYPDLDSYLDGGITSAPGDPYIQIVERPDRLI
ncbi:cytochrome P450 [Zychaea mexicana]|uniref:cytochrome P450 n=1 Tax=Zychaea mexicana TaxID=64656 RepID=UPI0022FDDA26|nr:cytochrome P450 [Zychaea mexicana]KAI9492124.1 cytochrome P450 [Zychaea mexicana]